MHQGGAGGTPGPPAAGQQAGAQAPQLAAPAAGSAEDQNPGQFFEAKYENLKTGFFQRLVQFLFLLSCNIINRTKCLI